MILLQFLNIQCGELLLYSAVLISCLSHADIRATAGENLLIWYQPRSQGSCII